MTELLDFLDNILWGSLLIYLLLGTSIYFSFRTRFIQFRRFGHMFSTLVAQPRKDPRGLSTFQTLCISLAARIGTGNLVGVAIALTGGGPGAIFWMWLIALLGMATSLIENTLAQLYKSLDSNGRFHGGPAVYMEKGLGMRWMGVLFSILLVLSFGLVFNALQANSITQAVTGVFNVEPLYVGIIIAGVCSIAIFGGLRSISSISQWLLPIMSVAYILLALWVTLHHVERLPDVFMLIIKSAFGIQEAAAGAIGYGMTQAMMQGTQRGLFSNEIGMGSSPNISALAAPNPTHPVWIGFSQMLGVFFDTLVICSATAAMILSSGVLNNPEQQIEGITLLQKAITPTTGQWGSTLLPIFVFVFAFSSIIANYAYAENNLRFLKNASQEKLFIYRCLVIAMLVFGSLVDLPLVWKMADIAMAFMTLTNITAIWLLSGVALIVIKDYERQRNMGKVPVFNPVHFPQIRSQLEPGIWEPHKPSIQTNNGK